MPQASGVTRRVALAGVGASILAACGATGQARRTRPTYTRYEYGSNENLQYGILGLPVGSARGTVVVIHGGSWRAGDNIAGIEPLSAALTADGFRTWTIEYRTRGNGGGYPETLTDIAKAVDYLGTLARRSDLAGENLLDRIVLLGHSAGAQLAVWEASRRSRLLGSRPAVPLTSVVSLAGPLVFDMAMRLPVLGSVIEEFLGGTAAELPARYALADPARLLPATVPVWAVTGVADTIVPPVIAQRYVELDVMAGGHASLVRVEATHTSIIQVDAPSFATVLSTVRTAATTQSS